MQQKNLWVVTCSELIDGILTNRILKVCLTRDSARSRVKIDKRFWTGYYPKAYPDKQVLIHHKIQKVPYEVQEGQDSVWVVIAKTHIIPSFVGWYRTRKTARTLVSWLKNQNSDWQNAYWSSDFTYQIVKVEIDKFVSLAI